MSTSSAPLLQTRDLVLGGTPALEVGSHTVSGPTLGLWDAAGIILGALKDERKIVAGSILIDGEEPHHLLATGDAAYVPQSLPLPPTTKVRDALTLSCRLIGLGSSDAERAMSRCRLKGHATKRLGQLSSLQMRLLCLAHGLCGHPQVLLLENLFEDLDEADAAVIEALLDVELADRKFIAAISSRDPESRSLALRSHQVLKMAGNEVLPPSSPSNITSEGYWVSCSGDATALMDRLASTGAQVTRSPKESVLLVRKASGSAIYRAAQAEKLTVMELTPAGSSGDF